ncbi:uncharacterized protein G2W53_031420 [Senna tora]|uniref:Uncharacterized protein n=1 Tax=Senna tora TaxID=362788 RepID=A0A834T965_9FABA|nr:uncharacterized protein G2W53_031420 [Senna tora]
MAAATLELLTNELNRRSRCWTA